MRVILRVLCRALTLPVAFAAGWWLRANMDGSKDTHAVKAAARPQARGRQYEPRRSLAEPDSGPPPPLDLQAFRALNKVRQQPRPRRRRTAG